MLRQDGIALLVCVFCCLGAAAQSAQPTNDILFKTLMVKSNTEAGTMFSIDVDGREYWLTAKHILTGRKSGPAGEISEKAVSLDVLDPIGEAIRWNPIQFTVIDPGKDIDIVVLVPNIELQTVPIPSLKVASTGMGMGQECSFLGFPFANTWTATFSNSIQYKMPFIKHCYISGIIRQPGTNASIIVLDGINNPGFSGGPVLFHTGPDQVVLGVISGYHPEPGEVHSIEVPDVTTAAQKPDEKKPNPNRTKKKDVGDLNTGIIVAFLANAAIDAIKKNPIGRVEAK
jgi:hypothetical protein